MTSERTSPTSQDSLQSKQSLLQETNTSPYFGPLMIEPPYDGIDSSFNILDHLLNVPDGHLNRKHRDFVEEMESTGRRVGKAVVDSNSIVCKADYLQVLKKLYEETKQKPANFFMYYLGEAYRPSHIPRSQTTPKTAASDTTDKAGVLAELEYLPKLHMERMDAEIKRLQKILRSQMLHRIEDFEERCDIRLTMLTDVSNWLMDQQQIMDAQLLSFYNMWSLFDDGKELTLYQQLNSFMEFFEKAVHETRRLATLLFGLGLTPDELETLRSAESKPKEIPAPVKLTASQIPTAGAMLKRREKFGWAVRKLNDIFTVCEKLAESPDVQNKSPTSRSVMAGKASDYAASQAAGLTALGSAIQLFNNMMEVIKSNFGELEDLDESLAYLHKKLAEVCKALGEGTEKLAEKTRIYKALESKYHKLKKNLKTVLIQNERLEGKLDYLGKAYTQLHEEQQAEKSDVPQKRTDTQVAAEDEAASKDDAGSKHDVGAKPGSQVVYRATLAAAQLKTRPQVSTETSARYAPSAPPPDTDAKLDETKTENIMGEIEFYKATICKLKKRIDSLRVFAQKLEDDIGIIPGQGMRRISRLPEHIQEALEKAAVIAEGVKSTEAGSQQASTDASTTPSSAGTYRSLKTPPSTPMAQKERLLKSRQGLPKFPSAASKRPVQESDQTARRKTSPLLAKESGKPPPSGKRLSEAVAKDAQLKTGEEPESAMKKGKSDQTQGKKQAGAPETGKSRAGTSPSSPKDDVFGSAEQQDLLGSDDLKVEVDQKAFQATVSEKSGESLRKSRSKESVRRGNLKSLGKGTADSKRRLFAKTGKRPSLPIKPQKPEDLCVKKGAARRFLTKISEELPMDVYQDACAVYQTILQQFLSLGWQLSLILDSHDITDQAQKIRDIHGTLSEMLAKDPDEMIQGLSEGVETYFKDLQQIIQEALSGINIKTVEQRITEMRQEKIQELYQKSVKTQRKHTALEEQYRSLWFMYLELCENISSGRQLAQYDTVYVTQGEFNETPVTDAEMDLKVPKDLIDNNLSILAEAFQAKKISQKCIDTATKCLGELEDVYGDHLPFIVQMYWLYQRIGDVESLTTEQFKLHAFNIRKRLTWSKWRSNQKSRLRNQVLETNAKRLQWKARRAKVVFNAWFLFNQILMETGIKLIFPQQRSSSVDEATRNQFSKIVKDITKEKSVPLITPQNYQEVISTGKLPTSFSKRPSLAWGKNDANLQLDSRMAVRQATGSQGFAVTEANDGSNRPTAPGKVEKFADKQPKRMVFQRSPSISESLVETSGDGM